MRFSHQESAIQLSELTYAKPKSYENITKSVESLPVGSDYCNML
jgi:hypothetical protein